MKSKKIVASVVAMSVLAMSSMSFAQITLKGNSKIANLSIIKPVKVNVETGSQITHITAKDDTVKTAMAGKITGDGTKPTDEQISVGTPGEDVKQKCETLLYKQVA